MRARQPPPSPSSSPFPSSPRVTSCHSFVLHPHARSSPPVKNKALKKQNTSWPDQSLKKGAKSSKATRSYKLVGSFQSPPKPMLITHGTTRRITDRASDSAVFASPTQGFHPVRCYVRKRTRRVSYCKSEKEGCHVWAQKGRRKHFLDDSAGKVGQDNFNVWNWIIQGDQRVVDGCKDRVSLALNSNRASSPRQQERK